MVPTVTYILRDIGTPLYIYRGIATIDIEMTNIDINQCDEDEEDEWYEWDEGADASSLDVFMGSHRCHTTTKV